jgi:C4-dicarboxylate transporter, DctM subunit
MIGFTLFMLFIVLMLAGVPIGAALGLGGIVAIAWANADTQWWGLLAAPQNMQAGIAKYPLLALPMFVLVGAIFDRSGVAQRLVDFAVACVGRWWRCWWPWCWAAFRAPARPMPPRSAA